MPTNPNKNEDLGILKTNFFLNVTLSIEPQNGTEADKRQVDCSGLLKGLLKKITYKD